MKPKDLKGPYFWENRRPLLMDGVFFVPEYYKDHDIKLFPEFSTFFEREANQTYIEYCSGNGHWIIEKAIQNPESNWIAVEMCFERVRKIWSKVKNQNIKNLLIIHGEALTFSKYYLKDKSVAGVYINFPDPWPKQKHSKNRLLREEFFIELARICRDDGKITIATDDKIYLDQICSECSKVKQINFAFPPPYYICDWPNYGYSFFDELWRNKGKIIHYLILKFSGPTELVT